MYSLIFTFTKKKMYQILIIFIQIVPDEYLLKCKYIFIWYKNH